MSFKGKDVEVRLADFSRGGLKFRLVKGNVDPVVKHDLPWTVDRCSMNCRLFHDASSGMHRLAFVQPLDAQQFCSLFSRWSDGPEHSGQFIKVYDVISAPVSTGLRITPNR